MLVMFWLDRTRATNETLWCLSLPILLCLPVGLSAQPENSKTSTFVRVVATANKPDLTGRQEIKVRLEIDKDYFLTGRKIPDDLLSSQFKVNLAVKGKSIKSKVTYPSGRLQKDSVIGDYETYFGQIVVVAEVHRELGDESPIEISIGMRGFHHLRAT